MGLKNEKYLIGFLAVVILSSFVCIVVLRIAMGERKQRIADVTNSRTYQWYLQSSEALGERFSRKADDELKQLAATRLFKEGVAMEDLSLVFNLEPLELESVIRSHLKACSAEQ